VCYYDPDRTRKHRHRSYCSVSQNQAQLAEHRVWRQLDPAHASDEGSTCFYIGDYDAADHDFCSTRRFFGAFEVQTKGNRCRGRELATETKN